MSWPSSPPPLEAGDEGARGSATLRWGALRAAHAGWYRCRATWLDTDYSSIGYYLNVMSEYTMLFRPSHIFVSYFLINFVYDSKDKNEVLAGKLMTEEWILQILICNKILF